MALGVCFISLLALVNGLNDRNELFDRYYEIFPSGNRNAASHRWATYILERSEDMSERTLRDLFAGFCPVSGSPLSYSRSALRVSMTLPAAFGGNATGMMYYCCWPCICDTADFIKVDTKTIRTADGTKQYQFAVIGNPCERPEVIPSQAPDVNCQSGQLVKATMSDHGFVIIGMFFEPGIPEHSDSDVNSYPQQSMSGTCQERADMGHNSGMGTIFREVANIAPIQFAFGQQAEANVVQLTTNTSATRAFTTTSSSSIHTVTSMRNSATTTTTMISSMITVASSLGEQPDLTSFAHVRGLSDVLRVIFMILATCFAFKA